jgi:hypothetical protein
LYAWFYGYLEAIDRVDTCHICKLASNVVLVNACVFTGTLEAATLRALIMRMELYAIYQS